MFLAITAVYVADSDSLIRTSAIMLRRFPIRQNDSKGKSAKKAATLFLLLLKRVKAMLRKGLILVGLFLAAVEYFQEESLRVLTGS